MDVEIASFQALANDIAELDVETWTDEAKRFEVDGLEFRLIDSGSYRCAYRIQGLPYVVKIGDVRANYSEFERWYLASTKERRYLARVRAISEDNAVLIMNEIPRATSGSWAGDLAACDRLCTFFHSDFTWDLGGDNVRYTDKGWPKLVDYHVQIHRNGSTIQ